MADWTWSGGEWRAEFMWACGVEGMVSTGVDMPTKQFDEFVSDSEKLDCPDCRRAEIESRPPVPGHTPTQRKA